MVGEVQSRITFVLVWLERFYHSCIQIDILKESYAESAFKGKRFCWVFFTLAFSPYRWPCYFLTPEWRPGMPDVSPLSGILGLSFVSRFLYPLLFFCHLAVCFLLIFMLLVHSPAFFFFTDNSWTFFIKSEAYLYGFCWAAMRWWWVMYSTCRHIALVFASMHLCNSFSFFSCFCPFL